MNFIAGTVVKFEDCSQALVGESGFSKAICVTEKFSIQSHIEEDSEMAKNVNDFISWTFVSLTPLLAILWGAVAKGTSRTACNTPADQQD